MSAEELLDRIEQLPQAQRQWLIEKLRPVEEEIWSRLSAEQLLAQYAPEDSVYDSD